MRNNFEIEDLVGSMERTVKVPDKSMELSDNDMKIILDRYIESTKVCNDNQDFYDFVMNTKNECIAIMMYGHSRITKYFLKMIKRSLTDDTKPVSQIAQGFMKLRALIDAPAVLEDAYRRDINQFF